MSSRTGGGDSVEAEFLKARVRTVQSRRASVSAAHSFPPVNILNMPNAISHEFAALQYRETVPLEDYVWKQVCTYC